MPTYIPTSPRVWRQPAVSDGRSDVLACAAFALVGLLVAVLAVNFDASRIEHNAAVATETIGTVVPGVP
jgi:hypothetical protein